MTVQIFPSNIKWKNFCPIKDSNYRDKTFVIIPINKNIKKLKKNKYIIIFIVIFRII